LLEIIRATDIISFWKIS